MWKGINLKKWNPNPGDELQGIYIHKCLGPYTQIVTYYLKSGEFIYCMDGDGWVDHYMEFVKFGQNIKITHRQKVEIQ
jgi:hypothetical protein